MSELAEPQPLAAVPTVVAPLPAVAPTQLEAAAADDQQKELVVSGQSFKLTKKLSLGASVDLDKAQREESIGGIVEAAARLVIPEQRKEFLELILNDEGLDLDAFLELMGEAMASVAGRPTTSADS